MGHPRLRERPRLPGGGLVPWEALFSALREIAFDGPILLESYNSSLGDFAHRRGMFHDVCPDADDFVRRGFAFIRSQLDLSSHGSTFPVD